MGYRWLLSEYGVGSPWNRGRKLEFRLRRVSIILNAIRRSPFHVCMSQPFTIRCCSCQSIWEAESLSTLIQCPVCLAMLELEAPTASALALGQSHELRWELARVMTIQAIARWRQRLLAEQPQLSDLPHDPQTPWWTDQRMIWRGIAIAGVLGLSLFFAPWQLTLALTAAVCYAIVIHPGWNHDERARHMVTLREQTMPLLMDLPCSDFAPGGRYANSPFDAAAWLQSAWGNHCHADLFQILGWQQKLIEDTSAAKSTEGAESHQQALRSYLRETKSLGTNVS